LKRGDVVTVAMQGDYGKQRPAIVVQSDLFNATHASVTVAPVTTTIVDAPLFRILVEPSSDNGLQSISQVMIDKLVTVRRDKVGKRIGVIDDETLQRMTRSLALWLSIAA
jgi:mRNA interferase MazF